MSRALQLTATERRPRAKGYKKSKDESTLKAIPLSHNSRNDSRVCKDIAKVHKKTEDQMTISNPTVERCIEQCLQCSRWCAQCRAEFLNEDPMMMRDCIRLCNECLELCLTCVALLTGDSEFAHRVCKICSELCTACAAECGKHEGETMRECAQACRQCAATCAEVAQAGPIRRAAA